MTDEAARFVEIYKNGLDLLEAEINRLSGGHFPGDVAFTLHDTHGFPFEVTEEIAAEAAQGEVCAARAYMQLGTSNGNAAIIVESIDTEATRKGICDAVIHKIRITGGEPLLRHGIEGLIARFGSDAPDGIRVLVASRVDMPDHGCLCCGVSADRLRSAYTQAHPRA